MNSGPVIPLESLRFLRRRIAEMHAPVPISAKLVAENIAFGAAVLGAGHVELVDKDAWWFVASNFNWLAAGAAARTEAELFERMLPFPEQGPTAHRAEIYVAVFAAEAYYRVGEAVTWIRGGSSKDALPDAGVTPPWCTTVVGFRLDARTGQTRTRFEGASAGRA